ncbi:MAG: peptidase M61 [Woeseiaceae bacterium]
MNHPRSKSRVSLALTGSFLLGAVVASGQPSATPRMDVVLAPGAVAPDGTVQGLNVTFTLSDVEVAAGEPLLKLALVSSNVDTVATTLEKLEARDDHGSLELVVTTDEESSAGAARHWAPARDVEGDVHVSYDVPIENNAGARGAAPPTEFRSEHGGVSAAGSIFLLLPEDAAPRRYSLRWDLGALPAGAVALSSYGVGDVEIATALAPERFAGSYFMAGAIGHYPDNGDAPGFFGGWQGIPPFDANSLMQWGERLHGWFLDFFRPAEAQAFGVFMRSNPVNPGGGVSLGNSFVVTYDAATDVEPLKLTLAHEMFHSFVHSLDAPQGLEASWFGEGLAVYYQRLLPLRAGQLSPAAFLEDLNETAGRYYTNALLDTPNAQIPARFWEDTRVRVLPYDRGSMYFARLDHRIRTASGGERSLDDLLLAMLELRRAGHPMDRAAWTRLVTEELGDAGKTGFESMLAGELMLPDSDAFGPCFVRTEKPLRRYQLGFEPRVLIENPRIVRGLLPESAAARAGLQNSDEILKPVGQDALQGDQDGWIDLDIHRGQRMFQVRYQPRGETVQAYQWTRRSDVPDSACAY